MPWLVAILNHGCELRWLGPFGGAGFELGPGEGLDCGYMDKPGGLQGSGGGLENPAAGLRALPQGPWGRVGPLGPEGTEE